MKRIAAVFSFALAAVALTPEAGSAELLEESRHTFEILHEPVSSADWQPFTRRQRDLDAIFSVGDTGSVAPASAGIRLSGPGVRAIDNRYPWDNQPIVRETPSLSRR